MALNKRHCSLEAEFERMKRMQKGKWFALFRTKFTRSAQLCYLFGFIHMLIRTLNVGFNIHEVRV